MSPKKTRAKPSAAVAVESLAASGVKLGFTQAFIARKPATSPASNCAEILARASTGVTQQSQNYLPGLMLAFVYVAQGLLEREGKTSQKDPLNHYERVKRRGSTTTTLSLKVPGDKNNQAFGIRPFMNRLAATLWDEPLARRGFPNAPLHNTRTWNEHRDVLDMVFAMRLPDRRALADGLWAQLMLLDRFADAGSLTLSPRPFWLLLANFRAETGDPPGAVFQGLVYAFYAADSTDVILEASKSRAGGARIGRVGDIDGRSGARLVRTAEVKDLRLTMDNWHSELSGFLRNLQGHADATALVFAAELDDRVREELEARGVHALDRADMLRTVATWDLNKQRVAARGFRYYVERIETNTKLAKRLADFARANDFTLD